MRIKGKIIGNTANHKKEVLWDAMTALLRLAFVMSDGSGAEAEESFCVWI